MLDPLALFESGNLWPSARWFETWPRLGVPSLLRGEWIPDIDVLDKDGKKVVRVDLPGMKREDIDVSIENDMLVVRGHREEEKEIKKEDYTYSERATGEFSRAIRLPEGVKEKNVDATYTDGVLEVTVKLPAAAAPKAKKIAIT